MAPNSKPSKTTAMRTLRPPALPREIIDSIFTALISLFDHDPAYQWTHFRSLTRFHRQQIDHHFPRKWLPELTLTLIQFPNEEITYHARRMRKHTDAVEFKAKPTKALAAQTPYLHDVVMATTYPLGDDERRHKHLILKMGEGILHGGAPGCGIISDMQLPGLRASDDGTTILFDWKAAFTALFGEEMLMRRYKDAMLARFMPSIKTRKRLARSREIHVFLLRAYQPLRRTMLTRYRDHLAVVGAPSIGGARTSFAPPFDVGAFVPADLNKDYRHGLPWFLDMRPWTIQDMVLEVECMAVHVPGWESLPERDRVVLRASQPATNSGYGANLWCAGG